MRKSKFSPAQIIRILRETEAGTTIPEICRAHGISKATFYRWQSLYGGMEISELERLKELEEENRRLKQMYADSRLENNVLKEIIEKKALTSAEKRELVDFAKESLGVSLRLACRALKLSPSVYRYRPDHNKDDSVVAVLLELADRYPRYGFGKMFPIIRRRGHPWNHKRVYRIYCELNLNIRRKGKKRLPSRNPEPLSVPEDINQCWSADFMSDALWCGRRFRTFNLVDDFNREVLTIEVARSLTADRVVAALERVVVWRGYPQKVRVDNGPELTSVRLADWAEQHNVTLEFIKPGRPMQNGFIERFNRTYRTEVLDMFVVKQLKEVQEITESWVKEYNEERPHESLGNLTPKEYLAVNQ